MRLWDWVPSFYCFALRTTKKTKKSQISQGRTSPFEADCIFIAAQKSKWERKANKELYTNAFIVFDLASETVTFEMWNIDILGLFTGIIWVCYITIIHKVASLLISCENLLLKTFSIH